MSLLLLIIALIATTSITTCLATELETTMARLKPQWLLKPQCLQSMMAELAELLSPIPFFQFSLMFRQLCQENEVRESVCVCCLL